MSDLLNRNTPCEKLTKNPCTAIKVVLKPKEKDLDSFTVRRLMPTAEMRSIGPFVFFDHLGPAYFPPGKGIDVRPHPHIGLATITFLFEGEILHRDSLGMVQPIRPNEINWMTAGRGIVHSERTPPELRDKGHTVHALQLWVALPEVDEKTAPAFHHYETDDLPLIEEEDKSIRVMIGEAYGVKSSVKTFSPTLYVAVNLKPGAKITVPEGIDERAVYVVAGALAINDTPVPLHNMVVFDSRPGIELMATEESQLVFIGGSNLGKRTVWWNLVATDKELIEKAKRDWQEGRFAKVPGETEFIPLP